MGCALMKLPGMKSQPLADPHEPGDNEQRGDDVAHDGQYEAILGVDQVGEAIGACLDASGGLVRHALTERDRDPTRRALIWLIRLPFPNQWTDPTVRPTKAPALPTSSVAAAEARTVAGLVWCGLGWLGLVGLGLQCHIGASGRSARLRDQLGDVALQVGQFVLLLARQQVAQ